MKNAGLMDSHLVHDLAHKEKFYWWHRVRRNNLMGHLKRHFPNGGKVLEIGSGTGENLRALKRYGFQVCGFELDREAAGYCQDLPVVQANAMQPFPFCAEGFDVVVILDVLEHLQDPSYVVKEIWRVLKGGGIVFVMVPADPKLWSYWDEMAGHCRRYTPLTLRKEFVHSWRCLEVFHTFSWMYFPVKMFRSFKKNNIKENHSDFVEVPKFINSSLIFIGKIESWFNRIVSLPIGTTVVGLWRKA